MVKKVNVKRLASAIVAMLLGAPSIAAIAGDTQSPVQVKLTVDASHDAGPVDDRVYGHFLEHIYHSCNGGLWGEVVWNRSFEETRSREPGWRVAAGVLETPPDATRETRFSFVENWRDYEYTLEVQKTGGDGELLVLFREDFGHSWDTLVLGKSCALESFGLNRQTRKSGTATLATAPGILENDRWHRVRVRCERYRLQAWLDEKPLFDATDKIGYQRGGIGVGARGAQGRFRNLQVTGLDGAVLLTSPTPSPARHWRTFGPGTVMLSTEEPLNDKHCLAIRGESGETGVSQSHICLRRGDTFRGSLWARGTGTLAVKLEGQEHTLPALSDVWKEYPLEFAPLGNESNATLQVFTRGKADVSIDQVSLMPDSARATGGYRADLLSAVKDLHPPLIRWPGGSFVAGYHWQNGIGPQSKRVGKNGWDELDPLSLGIDEFIALCRQTGAEPLVCVDARPDKPELVQEACDFIEYCNGGPTTKWGAVRAANGHPEPYHVMQWEVGNELWSMGTVRYCAVVRQFVPPMKKVDPRIQISVCGSSDFELQWNADVIAGCAELFDYLSIHHYEGITRFAEGPARYAAFWRETGKLIAASKNPRIRLFVSEWNGQSTDWRTGLYCGSLLNEFERADGLVAMATPALWLRHTNEVAWNNAFINFDSTGWFPAPNYVVMKLWRDHFATTRLALEGDPGPLSVVATRSADCRTLYVKAVNPSDESALVHVTVAGGFTPARATLKLVAPDDLKARNTLAERDAVRVVPGKVELLPGRVQFVLPRWSVVVVEIEG